MSYLILPKAAAFALCVVTISGAAIGDTTGLFPKPGAKDVCPDTPLKINLAAPATMGAGKFEVCDAADNSVVATVDAAQATRTQTIGGLPNYVVRPFSVDGNEITLLLPTHVLQYGKHYYINIPADTPGASMAGDKQWQFSTKSAPPAAAAKRIVVAADGTGDFVTIQGAIDFIPEGNKTPRLILIKAGTYNEIICLQNRDGITLLGEDRKKTIIAYANNDRFNPNAGGNPFGTGIGLPGTIDPKTGPVYRRGVVLAHRVADLTIANLTIHNTTPHGGSQAETIIFNGSADAAHFLLTDVDLLSFQDTIQLNGQAYINSSYIEGDVDFIWGTGPCFFQNVHARAVTNAAIFTTVRCPTTNHGFIFKDCTLDGNPNVTGTFLARVEANRFPTSETILLNTTMSNAIAPAGWRAPTGGDASNVHFWEYNSHDSGGKPIDTTHRIAASKRLDADADKESIAKYSDPTFVLAGWKPQLPPLIAASPAYVSTVPGGKIALTAQVVGIPSPTYQWQKNGTPIPGATQPTFNLESAAATDAGTYAITATNAAGSITGPPAQVQISTTGAK